MNMRESTIFFLSKSVSMALVTNDKEFAVAVRVTHFCFALQYFCNKIDAAIKISLPVVDLVSMLCR
jgi:hypothetical protein